MKSSSESFWLSSEKQIEFPILTQNVRTDVCIVGAGICGMTAAYLLTEEGKRVTVLDKSGLASGETGYTTAHLTEVLDDLYYELEKWHGKKAARLARESHGAAIDEIEMIINKEHIDCDFERVEGQIQFFEDQERELKKELAAHHRVELAASTKMGLTLHVPHQAQFHPLKYLHALYKILKERGVQFYQARAEEFEEEKGVTIKTAGNFKVLARDCIVATHSPANTKVKMHTKIYPYRTYVIAARIPKDSVPPVLFWGNLYAYHYVRIQRLKSYDLLIIGGEDHKTGHEEHPENRYDELEKWALKHYPQINKIEYRWSGQVMETMDGLAYIGLNPGNKHIYIATGFSGNGITYGTLSGILLRDLIQKRKNPWEKIYKPSRKNLHGPNTFLKENLKVAHDYMDLLKIGDKDYDDLKENEGAVIQQGKDKIAVYKDELGKVSACSAICTHLGCVVRWNGPEKSWDCPCHGSQFTPQGKVIHGPAVKPLKKVKLK